MTTEEGVCPLCSNTYSRNQGSLSEVDRETLCNVLTRVTANDAPLSADLSLGDSRLCTGESLREITVKRTVDKTSLIQH